MLPIGGGGGGDAASTYLFVEVDVSEEEVKIKISDYFYGAAPLLIVNDLQVPISYGQKGVTKWEEVMEGEGNSSVSQEVSVLPPKYMSFFCWIDPLSTREVVYRLPDDEQKKEKKVEREAINLDFDKYQKIDEEGLTGWVSFFDGKQRVLIFTENPELPQILLNVIFSGQFYNSCTN